MADAAAAGEKIKEKATYGGNEAEHKEEASQLDEEERETWKAIKKKKSSGSVKEKDSKKKSIDVEGPTDDATGQSNETAAPSAVNNKAASQEAAAPAPTPDGPTDQSPAEASGPTSVPKKSSSKSKSEVQEAPKPDETGETNAGSRKASTADVTKRKASTAGVSRKASTVDPVPEGAERREAKKKPPIEDEIGVLPDPDDMPQIKHTYVVPEAATKKDIDLLIDMDETKLMELKEAFGLFDYNQDGYIDFKDLKLTYQTLGQPDVPDEDILNMLAEAVSPLDFDAFVILLGYKTIEMDPEAILVEALSCWDYDNSGMISEDRIKHDLMTWGDRFTKEEVELALEDAPVYVSKKGKSMIDYIKFCNTLSGLRKKTRADMPENPEE